MKTEYKNYPVVALRGVSAFPGTMIHFDVERTLTVAALEKAMETEQTVFAVAQKAADVEKPGKDDLYEVGIVAKVSQIVKMTGNVLRVTLEGINRACLAELYQQDNMLTADVRELVEEDTAELTTSDIAKIRGLKDIFRLYAFTNGKLGTSLITQIMETDRVVTLVDQIASRVPIDFESRQMILCETNTENRYYKLCVLLNREIEITRLQKAIQQEVQVAVSKSQKDYYLREQLKAIHKELGDSDVLSDIERYRQKLRQLDAPKKVKKKIKAELARFSNVSTSSSESAVIRGYIEMLLSMPWNKASRDNDDIGHATEVLEKEHYGMKKVKERVIEFLAVRSMTGKGNSPIVCLVGPPGTGKTSIARGIAKALDKKYIRICLGGVRDEAEIRGHRRTYVGAMAGRVAKGIQSAKVKNPLILFDEVDKLGSDYKGDPSSALLEVLDAEQNRHFVDHYVEVPLDLSEVMFLCTANTTDTIPRPLLDRMELIEVPGYTANEKFHIAKKHLLPKQLEKNGLAVSQVRISDKALKNIISGYTKEAGVRGLERKLATICRKGAKELLENNQQVIRVNERNLKDYLGKVLYTPNKKNRKDEVGVVRGLAWTSVGGVTLEIEVVTMPGKGKLEMTGQMGDVMKESAAIALSYVRSISRSFHVANDYFEKHDFHIHIPEGATPKDGPSAGITMAVAFLSAVTKRSVHADLAMTGEVTLQGRVLGIGGLKEKLLAAKEAGITHVLVPGENKKDVEEIEEEILENMTLTYVDRMKDVIKEAMGE